jgi:Lon protease-like protein
MFPLSTVLFPHAPLPLHIFEPRYRTMTEECMGGDQHFGVVLIERGSEVGGGDVRVPVGTVAHIEEAARLEDGRWVMVVEGRQRIRVTEWLPDDPYPVATVADLESPGVSDGAEPTASALEEATAAVRRARALMSELGRSSAMGDPSAGGAPGDEDPSVVAWRLCAAAPLTELDRQRLLETEPTPARLELLVRLCRDVADDVERLLAGG